jgi:hypothetical protein
VIYYPTTASPKYEAQGPRRPGEVLQINRLGHHEIKWFAQDIKGNTSEVQSQKFLIGPEGTVSGEVPATLALTVGTGSLGAFQAGVARAYETSMAANVVSTAGEATLSVTDPSSTATGRLINGPFSLPQPLEFKASSTAGGPGLAYAPLSSTPGTPVNLLSYGGPTSNDQVAIGVRQAIGANDALRTGLYSKTLTFTLSTNSP